MKRLILSIAIFLSAGSLTAQPVPPTIDIITSVDTITYILPIFQYSIELSTIQAEPPTSFQLQLQIPIDQIKEKSPQRRDLKSQISYLMPLALAMYIWRDELTEFSNKHDKAAHAFLAFGMTKMFGWKFALGFMLSIEATQGDIFGMAGRYTDTAEDLVCDLAAIGIAFKLEF